MATKLSGREIKVTPAMESQAFWLLKRYTSLAFIERAYLLWANFLAGLEEAARTAPDERSGWFIDTLRDLIPYQTRLEAGLTQLALANRTSGYDNVRLASHLSDFVFGRRFDDGLQWSDFGLARDQPVRGLFSWANSACRLVSLSEVTLVAGWSYQSMLLHPEEFGETSLPDRALEPLPQAAGPLLNVGELVVVGGIYSPVDLPNPCPNYLIQGTSAPEATVPTKRFDWPALRGGTYSNGVEYPPVPARSVFEFGLRPTRWRLLWEDRRYEAGKIADEAEYLLPDSDFPPYPPRRDPEEPWPKF